ncbi:MAG: ion transporter [Cytophagales bacterium]|nr:MAG: ion transporter [Cytophagales bacterium]
MQRDFLYLLSMNIQKNTKPRKTALIFILEKILPILNQILHYFILLNIIVICLETMEELSKFRDIFLIIEDISVIFFTLEYIIRILYSIYNKKPFKYIFSFMGIIDLLSIIPFYLPLLTGSKLSFFKVLRLFRLLRILKLYRYSDHLQTVIEVIKHKLEYLTALFFATLIVVLFCSCAAYYFEHDAQPQKFTNIFSSLWWAISTVMTIGYGDIVPITIGGKIMATILGFVGISLLAVLAGIFSAGFVEIVDKKKVGGIARKENFKPKKEE